jgi:MYXO-CTERM domain-containing protein
MPPGVPYLAFDQNAPSKSQVALTFDDGPDVDGSTASVLDTLKAAGVKATFFINTNNAVDVASSSTAQKLIRRMHDEGHHVGNHTVHHYDLGKTTTDVDAELDGVQDLLWTIAPSTLDQRLVRAPYGNPYAGPQDALDRVAPIVAKYGVHIGWNVDSKDFDDCNASGKGPSCVSTNVLNLIDAGKSGIVLLHCILPITATALPDLIAALKSRGKRFVLVEDLVVAKYGVSSLDLIDPPPTPEPDAGAPDTRPRDTGVIDSGSRDTGAHDSAPVDSGAIDTGIVDTKPSPDASLPDDTGAPPIDAVAGAGDPDTEPDVAQPTPQPEDDTSISATPKGTISEAADDPGDGSFVGTGCACRTGAPESVPRGATVALGFAVVAAFARRRRRSRARVDRPCRPSIAREAAHRARSSCLATGTPIGCCSASSRSSSPSPRSSSCCSPSGAPT